MKQLSAIEKLILSESLFDKKKGIVSRAPRLYSNADKELSAVEKKQKEALSKLEKASEWSVDKAESIESLDAKYQNLIKILEFFSWIPIPAGNPASLALAGDSIARNDYLNAIINIIGALPGVGAFGKVVSLARGAPMWVSRLLNLANRLGVYNLVKPAILWMARSIKNINMHKILTWDLYKRYALKNLGQNAFFEKVKKSSYGNYALLSFGNEEMVPNKNFQKAQAELKQIGMDLEKAINSVDKEINPSDPAKPASGVSVKATPPPEELIMQQKVDSLRKGNFKSLTDKDLKEMIDKRKEYKLSDKDVLIAETELSDREIDVELGISRL